MAFSCNFGSYNWPNVVRIPIYWIWDSSGVMIWNIKWTSFLYDARRTPMILAIGKIWSWAFPIVEIPLWLFAGLRLIRVLNITWGSVWKSSTALVAELACRAFKIMDDFLDHSQVLHII